MGDARLVVGLGNPGQKYSRTRHNLGFMVLEALAAKRGAAFKKQSQMQGYVAELRLAERKDYLLMPTTYMNLSGQSMKKVMSWYKLAAKSVLVVVDDVDLPFGSMRLRTVGSSGGHNGLKSIEAHLNTREYARLRVGIGPASKSVVIDEPLEKYVLRGFDPTEVKELPRVIERSVEIVECWLQEGEEQAIRMAK